MDDSAINDLSYALRLGLDETDQQVGDIAVKVGTWLDSSVASVDKLANKTAKKIHRYISTTHTQCGNSIDQVATRLIQWLSNTILSQEWTLGGVSVKAGIVSPGCGIDDAIFGPDDRAEIDQSPAGTIVLDCRMLAEQLAPLIEVLREIRDRIGGVPAAIAGETPESSPVPEWHTVDLGDALVSRWAPDESTANT